MSKVKNKVMHRLNSMLDQYREIHRNEKNEIHKENLRLLILKQVEIIEWASEVFEEPKKTKKTAEEF